MRSAINRNLVKKNQLMQVASVRGKKITDPEVFKTKSTESYSASITAKEDKLSVSEYEARKKELNKVKPVIPKAVTHFDIDHNWYDLIGQELDEQLGFTDNMVKLPFPSMTVTLNYIPGISGCKIKLVQDETNNQIVFYNIPAAKDITKENIKKHILTAFFALESSIAKQKKTGSYDLLKTSKSAPSTEDVYYILPINLNRTRTSSKSGGKSAGGNSKRMHLRRGHWRRVYGGKVWIKAHIVCKGSIGKVYKTYSV